MKPAGLLLRFQELVLDAIDEGLVGRLDDILGYADSAPAFFFVSRFNKHPDLCGSPLARGKHAHFVIMEFYILEFRIELVERLSQGMVDCIDRTFSFCGSMFDAAADLHHDGRLAESTPRLLSSSRS